MLLEDLVRALDLTVILSGPGLKAEVKSGYASDLLSDVMGKASEGSLWVTMQCHPNVIAVASLLNFPAVLFTGGAKPDERTRERAETEGLVLLGTRMATFEAVGRLYAVGIRGISRHD